MTYYFKVLRPWQWLKNTLIFIPYILGREYFGADVIEVIYVFLIFSLFVSSTYIFNDIKDKDLDKLHPDKKYRPIASGKLETKNAIIFALLIFISTLLGSYLINHVTIFYFLTYALLTLLYSYKTKYAFFLDTLTVSLMFTVRIFIGGSVAEINPTIYLLSSVFFISCILSTSKKISIINTEGIHKDNIYYQMLKAQDQMIRFRTLFILFSIFSIGSLMLWLLNLRADNISMLRQSLLILCILGFIVFLNYIYKFSTLGKLEDFSSEIFNNKILLFLSSLIVISFFLGYFLI